MKKILLLPLLVFFITSCNILVYKIKEFENVVFKAITIDTLFQDKISIRAIQIDKNKIWYAADKGRFGYFNTDTNLKKEIEIAQDSLNLEFRSIAHTTANVFILNVGNPALLYKIAKKDLQLKLVYQESNEKVFFDSMQFWDENDGIAMGDPVSNCLNIILTKDGGETWNKIPCEKLPEIEQGEAAFAASNTNITVKGNKAWIVSGGKRSRVFHSSNRGESWKVYETPIVQGNAMTGIFTADFYDKRNGFIAGGNYEAQSQNFANKAISKNGGKTWKLIAENKGFGYASCVQYVPESKGKGLVVVGTSGVHYSADAGTTWKQLSTDPKFYTVRFVNKNTAIAAGKDKVVRFNFKE
ncbi:photosystem II stability/assembly factor-like uncharacterized protein [Flavobacterium sp. PL11]|uniref:WD40/YVTN/BNR-like repeat-containing protein n=1 Tax=Flavobacterium sp. PL11 TaxID=3071717 RepID=UPI002E06D9B9|nr:photosystem II stability/assembly factor-like uncharacterized protein [Flavobacterium sp. PL11]